MDTQTGRDKETTMKTKTTRMSMDISHSQGGESCCAYKGYLILPAMRGTIYYIQKGGFTIGSALTYREAEQLVDLVVG